ncbi:MAG: hypothetical protein IPG80_07570 [Anaerolineales bacterium]|uniref:hypothetical protein n=1 Tax=Candidatus Villigracilis vicinus TaxID=3140679 RepID=UPI0031369DDA|nr:hypothetical protein [Anaerolineales bacterium]
MKRNLFALLSLLVLASMVLAACGGAPEATEAPATEAAATEAPAAAEEAACAPAVPGWDPTTAETGEKGINIAFEQEPDQAVSQYSNMSFSAWIWQMYGIGPGKWDDQNNLIPLCRGRNPKRRKWRGFRRRLDNHLQAQGLHFLVRWRADHFC